MAGKVCSCNHGISWHALGGKRRLHCKSPACTCDLFDGVSGLTAVSPSVQNSLKPSQAMFVPNTAPANPVRAFTFTASDGVSESVVSSFMLDMAAKALAQQRLNKLSEDGVLSLANLGPNWCRDCVNLVERKRKASELSFMSYSVRGSTEWVRFNGHLTPKHVAEMFGVPENMLHSAALAYIRQHVNDSDQADVDDELGVIVGWRTWMLEYKVGKFRLVAPHAGVLSLGVEYRKIQATHYGDRELALQHLAAAKESVTVNENTLYVSVTRPTCTCGLYCYCNFEDFKATSYLNYAGITANVIPFGTVQMGADQRTLRASDFLINRLIVYYGTTNVNGTHCTPYENMCGLPHFEPWVQWVGEWVDPALVVYKAMCQQLADQFEVSVDLVVMGKENPENFEAIGQFEPVQNALPDWIKGGLTVQ